jgi:transposase-like protein
MQSINRAERRRSSKESAKRARWEALEEFTRRRIQDWMQDLLEEEVAEQLGRRKSERRAAVDAPHGYRNGHGQPRRLSMMAGTIELRRPRVRGLEQRFESRILPLFVRRTEQVSELLPQLYLHGLAQGDFELALRGLLGDGAPLSPSSIERLRGKWQLEYETWRRRRLDNLALVYAWAHGLYVKAGLEESKAALLVIIGALQDGRKVRGRRTDCGDQGAAPRVTVEDWEALRLLGFDERGCLEVAHIVGIFNYLTRLADGFGLELHPALTEAARSGIRLRRAGG